MALNRVAWLEILRDYIKYNGNEDAPLHSLRYLITGSFYHGKWANNWLRDVLAGGVANNFFFKWFPKGHGSFIYFLDALAKYQPSSFEELEKKLSNPAVDQNTIKTFIDEHKEFISHKYYLDLLEELEQLPQAHRTDPQKEEREAEANAKRVSKILAFFSALSEGFIDIMALLKVPALVLFLGLSWSSPVTWVIFGAACFVSYYFYDVDSFNILKKIWTGHFFQRNKNENAEEEPDYVPLSNAEIAFLCIFSVLSLCAGVCACGLAMYSTFLASASLLLTFALPPVLLLTGSFVLLEVIDNFIKHKAWNKICMFFQKHFECKSCIDVFRILFWEIPELFITTGVSIVISWAIYKLFSSKTSEICLRLFGAALTGLSIFCASVTACMKGIFSLSKVNEAIERLDSTLTTCGSRGNNTSDMLESLGGSTSFRGQESKTMEEAPTQTVARYCDNAHFVKNVFCISIHAGSQGMLFFKVGKEAYGVAGGITTGVCKSLFSASAMAAAVMPKKTMANHP